MTEGTIKVGQGERLQLGAPRGVHEERKGARDPGAGVLRRCLAVASERVIAASVRRLRPHHAAALLDAAVERLRARANRGAALTAWIRAVLLHHTAYLMAAPGVLPVLASLSQARSRARGGCNVFRVCP